MTRSAAFAFAFAAVSPLVVPSAARAQRILPAPARPAAPDTLPKAERAASLLSEAFDVAALNPGARVGAVRGAAALLPRLSPAERDNLTRRWLSLAMSGISRGVRLEAFSTFFDVAARADEPFARQQALALPDAAGRAGAYLQLARAVYPRDFLLANDYSQRALKAARLEPSALPRARALSFAALYIAGLNPATRRAAVTEASSAVRRLPAGKTRDSLLAEVVGAAAKFDLDLGRRMTNDISDNGLRGLANARVNLSEISQSTLTGTAQARITALAQAAAPYDARAIPILLGLPPQPEVLKTLAAALPPIAPNARPSVEISLLERLWDYSAKLDGSAPRDQLQSRLARLMTLQDPARGREWGKRLAWKGGRIQVGAFLKSVLQTRAAAFGGNATPMARMQLAGVPDLNDRSVSAAVAQARGLSPSARVEALLLIAGQLLA